MPKLSENVFQLLELSQSAQRGASGRPEVATRVSGCITLGQRVWLTSRNRFLHGVEALDIQGIHFGAEQEANMLGYSSKFLTDLTGIAFHSGCCGCALLSMFCTVGEALRRRRSYRLPPE